MHSSAIFSIFIKKNTDIINQTKIIMKRTGYFLVIAGLLLTGNIVNSQINEIGKMMIGGKDDGTLLLKEYITPYANALGANLSGGWYNTAKPHKLGGFDLTLTLNTAFVPKADKSFDIAGLDGLNASVTGNELAPTAAGKKEAGPELSYTYAGEDISYNTPQGTGVGFMPSPLIKIGVGFVKETEITGRFMPTMSMGKFGKIGLWGFGLKHSLKQYIPAINKIPVLNLSLMGGYSKLSSSFDLNVTPEDFGATASNLMGGTNFDNQTMDLEVNNITGNILVSADLPVVCFYGGAGFSYAKTNLALNGFYPVGVSVENDNLVVTDNDVAENPLNIEIENKDGSTTKPRLNVGMRLKLGVITWHFDYTRAFYSVATTGLGISLR